MTGCLSYVGNHDSYCESPSPRIADDLPSPSVITPSIDVDPPSLNEHVPEILVERADYPSDRKLPIPTLHNTLHEEVYSSIRTRSHRKMLYATEPAIGTLRCLRILACPPGIPFSTFDLDA